jgi:hypothetical protein
MHAPPQSPLRRQSTQQAVAAGRQLHPAFFCKGLVHSAYNSSFSVCFFNRNNIFLSQQISQQCFSAGLSAQPNGSKEESEPEKSAHC